MAKYGSVAFVEKFHQQTIAYLFTKVKLIFHLMFSEPYARNVMIGTLQDTNRLSTQGDKMDDAQFEIQQKQVVFTDEDGGAILLENEMWYPFRYFDGGGKDIDETDGYLKPSTAYKMAKLIFT